MRFQQIYDKLIFCIRVTAGPGTFVRLLVNSKRLDRYQRSGKAGEVARRSTATREAVTIERAVAYAIRYLSRDWTLYLRTYAGDIRIFYEIFLERIYRLPVSVVKDPLVIVDAGANIGMAGVYLSIVHPRARIYCIEPEAGNVEVLRKNMAGPVKEGSVVLVEAALHDRDGVVNLSGDGWAYNYTVRELADDAGGEPPAGKDTRGSGGGRSVRAITPSTLIAKFGLERIDLMKIDIEGAEEGLFRGDTAWLDHVEVLLIEIHTGEGKKLIRERLEEKGFAVGVTGKGDSLFLASKKRN
jgi:FkbM family methyltransferase